MKILKFSLYVLILGAIITMSSCSEPEEVIVPPPSTDDLSFTYTVDSENANLYHFVGETSVDTWYVHWNFGDNTGDEGLMPSKVFFKKGTYDVRFKIFTEGGTAEIIETIVIEDDFSGPDLITNGSLDTDEGWTIVQVSPGVELSLDGGQAAWSGGGWGNAILYQQVEVEANKEYTISMEISGGSMSESWFEIYMGTEQPQPNVDYSSGGILTGLNTWEGCGGDVLAGQLVDYACVGEGNKFTWEEGKTAYFVIKSGGADLGTGITVDNIAIRSL